VTHIVTRPAVGPTAKRWIVVPVFFRNWPGLPIRPYLFSAPDTYHEKGSAGNSVGVGKRTRRVSFPNALPGNAPQHNFHLPDIRRLVNIQEMRYAGTVLQ
jgi:hypothetical protein